MSDVVAMGDRVLLLEPDTERVHLVVAEGPVRKERGLGVVDPTRLVGTPWGHVVAFGAKTVAVLRPAVTDLAATLERKAQIILPKDASRIVYELGITQGDWVLESGVGSGAATVALASAVGDAGRVVVQELRDDFAVFARGNLERAGLASRVDIHVGDLTVGVSPGIQAGFDAALLDMPEPWKALPHVANLLAVGGRVACYCPQVSQMEETVRTLRSLGFLMVRAMELIERTWEVKERGSRPSFDGLGHTGFLVFGRRVAADVGRDA